MTQEEPYPVANETTVRPVPRSTVSRLSPISPDESPTSAVFSLPSLPLSPHPQHARLASSSMAQVMSSPAAMLVAVRPEGSSTSS